MKVGKSSVSSTSFNPASKAYAKASPVSETSRGPADSVEVSESGSLFRQAVDAAQNTPDIRAEPVAKAQQELESGNYKRDDRAVADKMIQDHIAPRE